MPRPILSEEKIHPAAQRVVAENHRDIVEEVMAAIESNDVVVVGMAQNPHPRRALKALKAKQIPHRYLEYGSYLSEWRRRNALKMWTGWPTFPMCFHRGVLLGGANELIGAIERGELG